MPDTFFVRYVIVDFRYKVKHRYRRRSTVAWRERGGFVRQKKGWRKREIVSKYNLIKG